MRATTGAMNASVSTAMTAVTTAATWVRAPAHPGRGADGGPDREERPRPAGPRPPARHHDHERRHADRERRRGKFGGVQRERTQVPKEAGLLEMNPGELRQLVDDDDEADA